MEEHDPGNVGVNTAAMEHYIVPECFTEAHRVIELLETQVSLQLNDNPNPHSAFARLYLCVTKRWLSVCRQCKDPRFLCILVVEFFGLYWFYVQNENRPQTRRELRHWWLYSIITNSSWFSKMRVLNTMALLLAIRAHIRFDLAEAICRSYRIYTYKYSVPPNTNHLEAMLFSLSSDMIFKKASTEYFESCRSNAQSSFILKFGCNWLRHCWMPIFHRARRLAWLDAQLSIKSGQALDRFKGISARRSVDLNMQTIATAQNHPNSIFS